LDAAGRRHGFDVFYPAPELCTDNGAMIAFAASLRLADGEGESKSGFSVKPRWDMSGLS
jgi:N6-L-threonylcarbamoyladenine synthase